MTSDNSTTHADSDEQRPPVLCDMFEPLVGAVYLRTSLILLHGGSFI